MTNKYSQSQKWNAEDVMDFINEIEERFDVDEWIVDNIHIWPILRFQLGFRLDNATIKKSNIRKDQLIKQAFKKGFKIPLGLYKNYCASLLDQKGNDNLKEKTDVVFITYPTTRRFLINNNWFDVYCDPIINLLNEKKIKSAVLEYSPSFEFKIPRYHKSIFIQPALTFLLYTSALKANRISIPEKTINGLTNYFSYLRNKKLHHYVPDLLFVKNRISYMRHLSEYFKSVFRKVRPSLVIMPNYYRLGMAANLACRELGIVSVDIQHGVQGDMHVAYGRWNKVPEETGYGLLPAIFWNWSESDEQAILKWSKPVEEYHRPIVGGNPILAFFNQKDNKFLKHYDERIKHIVSKNRINVLISLQWGRDCGLSDLYQKAIMNSRDNYFWWLRLHPVMSESERKKVFKQVKSVGSENININDATEIPLYIILQHMDVHVTENSTVVLEAEQFGVPSVITHSSGVALYQNQVKRGSAVFADTRDKLIDTIKMFGKKTQRYTPKYTDANQAIDLLLSFAKRRKA